ncbi:hypothetical protein CAI16_06840 [Virgibacillus dokdonensis]|uniref:Uncharacterized protein n=1 Tax=Virgibacillus dokdonensis TaxID=302167 RepID=A0A3E0WVH0_9BACI|nr:hypothetical protein CAI16_06840 [Virgibacillus dokdonensis]
MFKSKQELVVAIKLHFCKVKFPFDCFHFTFFFVAHSLDYKQYKFINPLKRTRIILLAKECYTGNNQSLGRSVR